MAEGRAPTGKVAVLPGPSKDWRRDHIMRDILTELKTIRELLENQVEVANKMIEENKARGREAAFGLQHILGILPDDLKPLATQAIDTLKGD